MKEHFVGLRLQLLVRVEDVGGVVDEVADGDTDAKIGEARANVHHVVEEVGSIVDASSDK